MTREQKLRSMLNDARAMRDLARDVTEPNPRGHAIMAALETLVRNLSVEADNDAMTLHDVPIGDIVARSNSIGSETHVRVVGRDSRGTQWRYVGESSRSFHTLEASNPGLTDWEPFVSGRVWRAKRGLPAPARFCG